MKKSIGVLLGALLLLLVAPWGIGQWVAKKDAEAVAQYNQQYPMYKLETVKKEVGIWQSRYAYRISLNSGSEPSFSYAVPNVVYNHGPIPFTALRNPAPFTLAAATLYSDASWQDVYSGLVDYFSAIEEDTGSSAVSQKQQRLNALLSRLGSVDLRGKVGFGGAYDVTAGALAGEFEFGEGQKLSWGQLEMAATGSLSDWNQVDVSVRSGGARGLQADGSSAWAVGGASLQFDSTPSEYLIPTGEFELQIESLTVVADKQKALSLDRLGYSGGLTYTDPQTLVFEGTYALSNLVTANWSVDDAKLGLALTGLTPESFELFYKNYNDILPRLAASVPPVSATPQEQAAANQQNAAVWAQLMPAFAYLLEDEPSIVLDVNLNGQKIASKEPLMLQSEATLGLAAGTAEYLLKLQDPMLLGIMLMTAIEAEWDVTVSDPLARGVAQAAARSKVQQYQTQARAAGQAGIAAEQLAQMQANMAEQILSGLQQQGFLQSEKGLLHSEGQYRQGQITINGQALGAQP